MEYVKAHSPGTARLVADALFSLELSTWKNDLPTEIDFVKSSPCAPQPHQLMLHMTYYWLTILLHRPFYRRRRSCEDLNDYTDHIKVWIIFQVLLDHHSCLEKL